MSIFSMNRAAWGRTPVLRNAGLFADTHLQHEKNSQVNRCGIFSQVQ